MEIDDYNFSEISVDEYVEFFFNAIAENKFYYLRTPFLIYKEPNHEASCKQLSEKYHGQPESYNSHAVSLAKKIQQKYQNLKNVRPWQVLFTGRYDGTKNNYFLWKLRPNLTEAISFILKQEDENMIYKNIRKLDTNAENLADSINVWRLHVKPSPVRNGSITEKEVVDYCVKNRIMAMGYRVEKDKESTIDNDFNKYLSSVPTTKDVSNVKRMVNDVKTNDLVWLSDGTDYYLARVNENRTWKYVVNEDTNKYGIPNQIENIFWHKVVDFDKKYEFKSQKAIYKAEKNKKQILAYSMECFNKLRNGNESYEYNKDVIAVLKNSSDKETAYSPYAKKLLSGKNIIFRGAPGTGKTYLSKNIAAEIVSNGQQQNYDNLSEEEKSRIGFVQFHPSYDYSDFVEGLRPITTENNQMIFEVKSGCFKTFVDKAINHGFEEEAFSDEDVEHILEEYLSEYIDKDDNDDVFFKTVKEGTEFYITGSDDKYIQTCVPSHTQQKDSGLRKDVLKLLLKADIDFSSPTKLFEYVNDKVDPKYHKGNASYMLPVYNHIREQKIYFDTKKRHTSNTQKNYVFIIDEINRGEISKIFGELFFSIDPGYRGDKGAVLTQYSYLHDDPEEKFYIPDNLYIIGTMNDIDRSVDSFDFAMRRRFRFVNISAEDSMNMLNDLGNAEQIKNRMWNLNEVIANTEGLNENYQIGAAYFKKLEQLKTDSGSYDFDALWSDYLEPLLHDYVVGMPNEVELMKDFKTQYDNEEIHIAQKHDPNDKSEE